MTEHHDGQRPSWYNSGRRQGTSSDARSADQPSNDPSAAAAGGYGVSSYGSSGYSSIGYGYSAPEGYSPHQGYPRTQGYSTAQGYSDTPGTDELNTWESQRELANAQGNATTALVLGIIGLFTLPFILGPLALWQAGRARRRGVEATAGLALGWICTIWGGLVVIFWTLGLFLFIAAATF